MNDQPLILVVEDFPQNLQVLGKNLENAGYDITVAMSGEEALETLKTTTPDLILLDVMMPGIDGFETCKRIQAEDKLKHIPIIFLTARAEPEDITRGYESGAVDYINKPFNRLELLTRVATHLKLKAAEEKLATLCN